MATEAGALSGRKEMSKLPRVVSTRTTGRLGTSRVGSDMSFGASGGTKDSRLSLSPASSLNKPSAFENLPPFTNKPAVVRSFANVNTAV